MHRLYRSTADSPNVHHLAAATAYDRAGEDYTIYADGESDQLFAFIGLHAYADKCVWERLDAKLRALRATGATAVRMLDAGCGPGTWLRRLVAHAFALGFTDIHARGFDIAEMQISTAIEKSTVLAKLPGVHLSFEVADLIAPLPEADRSVDLTLCLYSVLSHLPRENLPRVAKEFARVTRGHFVTTVRTAGSTPTVYVTSVEKARDFLQDHGRDRCTVELSNGARLEMRSHLFTAQELRTVFGRAFDVEDLCGLDIFHGRFAPDRRWNPRNIGVDDVMEGELARLEEAYRHDRHLMDRANHLLLIGKARH